MKHEIFSFASASDICNNPQKILSVQLHTDVLIVLTEVSVCNLNF